MERVSKREIVALNVLVSTAICFFFIAFFSLSSEPLRSSQLRDTTTSSGDTSPTRLLVENPYVNTLNCVEQDDFEELFSNAKQTFVMTPARASDTNMIEYGKMCAKSEFKLTSEMQDKLDFITAYDYPSKLLVSHIDDDRYIINMAETMDRKSTLMIYMYRNELDRLQSSIEFVAKADICGFEAGYESRHLFFMEKFAEYFPSLNSRKMEDLIKIEGDTKCTIDEDLLLATVEKRFAEMRQGSSSRILSCDVYQTIKTTNANMMFIHYEQADALQKMMAKSLCPEMLESRMVPVSNVRSEKETTINVYSTKSEATLELSDWVEAKGRLLQWAFGLNQQDKGVKCQRQTYEIENEIDRCPSKMIRVPNFAY